MSAVLRVFYTRRFLRIFPLYYGVLAFCLIFGVGPIYGTWPWHVSYLSNIYYAWHGHADAVTDPFLHFWSLAVEEQFYLLWPLVTLTASRRGLLFLLYGCIAGSLAFRIGVAHLAPQITSVRYLTPSCLDALAVGALVAHARHYRGAAGVRRMAWSLAAVGGFGLVLAVIFLGRVIGPADAHRVGHTFLVIFYGFIVAQASMGFRGPVGRLLSFKPVLYVGRISYGLYVFHYFAPAAIGYIGRQTGLETAFRDPAFALPAYAVFSLIVAALSWHLYELPINRLKRHFAYPRRTAPTASLAPQVPAPIPNV
jgi:peptidoglycan/LPS O-acetylase OafA/YrhL